MRTCGGERMIFYNIIKYLVATVFPPRILIKLREADVNVFLWFL
jgi:hypothetical protein